MGGAPDWWMEQDGIEALVDGLLAATADTDAAIIAAFNEWATVSRVVNSYDTDEDCPEEYERLCRVEDRLLRLRPKTARGLAIQFQVATGFGAFTADGTSLGLLGDDPKVMVDEYIGSFAQVSDPGLPPANEVVTRPGLPDATVGPDQDALTGCIQKLNSAAQSVRDLHSVYEVLDNIKYPLDMFHYDDAAEEIRRYVEGLSNYVLRVQSDIAETLMRTEPSEDDVGIRSFIIAQHQINCAEGPVRAMGGISEDLRDQFPPEIEV